MQIKRYTIAALLLMTLVGAFVHTYITQETVSIDFFGIPMPSLSIAIWVVLPIFVLYIASVLHMTFYSIMGTLNLRKYEKDHEKIIDAISDTYLGKKSRSYNFKTEKYKILGTLLENTTIFPNSNIVGKTNNTKIDTVLQAIEDIKNSKVVDLKEYNLSIENEMVIQNERNRYKAGEVSADTILSHSSKYSETLRKDVFVDFVKTAPLSSVEKYKALLTKESLYPLLARVNADEFTLAISTDELLSLFEKLELTREDYIKLSETLSHGGMLPDQRIKLFERLSDKKEIVMDAYLYTLFDLEMMEAIDSLLQISQPDEYLDFKAYRALKECGHHFNIELFFSI
ncbi:hypothetical protein GJV85_07010 [Sulfurimonas aquatica]|uniref:LapA family protein n=1 Tax=Sulfurimonas aquatica TaxID=2672570 RepID=A0A975B0G9_9BACT|nr:hypothetical protein [Sulfurimonas aquatica]QSZ41865.1 hypothetical protein GJV85_07010 [Sulfurimonas aquatica]